MVIVGINTFSAPATPSDLYTWVNEFFSFMNKPWSFIGFYFTLMDVVYVSGGFILISLALYQLFITIGGKHNR